MKKLTLHDNSIIESEIGWDNIDHRWSIPLNVKTIEFEDGTILENPDFEIPEVE